VIFPGRLREDYKGHALDVADVHPDPITQFHRWFDEAVGEGVAEPDAMTLATVDAEGSPRARVVLLRGLDERGFAFYTNRESAKGRELAGNPLAALTFAWLEIYRQVRVTGAASTLPDEESDAYFATRPRGAQVGAWASPQSAPLADRATLEARVAEVEERFAALAHVPRPPFWGGYVVRPETVELWQGRPNRLHDRVRYRRDGEAWIIERLAP